MIYAMLTYLVTRLLYKLWDECQDESVNSHWGLRKFRFGLSLQFLNKKPPLGMSPHWGWGRKWKWHDITTGEGSRTVIMPTRRIDKLRYLNLYKPTHAERFPYSSTFLVAFTDGEHLFQLLKEITLSAGFAYLFGLTEYGEPYRFVSRYAFAHAGLLLGGAIKELRK